MAEKKQTAVAVTRATSKVDDQVLERVEELAAMGFMMPADFNYINAVKMSMLKLQEVKDKNGRPAIEACTTQSIAAGLFKMCTKGLNAALNQCYLIVRGDQLCVDPSYFGNVLQVKRIFPDWEPYPHAIREGDEFEFCIDPGNGHRHLIKHVQTLESMDNPFIGGYVILPTKDGDGDLYIMTKKQILAAWAKSGSQQHATHNQFDEKMIGKTLVNSGCNMIINSTPSLGGMDVDGSDPNAPAEEVVDTEAEEVVDTETGEIRQLDADGEGQTEQAAAPAPEAPSSDPDDF